MPSAGHEGPVQLRKGGLWPGWRRHRELQEWKSVSLCVSVCLRGVRGLKDRPDMGSAQEILTLCAFSGVVGVSEIST